METKILIVDDEAVNRYLLQKLFESQGWNVCAAENGQIALETARNELPDLIISDILMPEMDGYALCRNCKADEQLKAIPFVFYTGTYTDAQDEKFALDLGANLFLQKPQEAQELIKNITTLLKKPSAGTAAVAEDLKFFKGHSEILSRKLTKKMEDLDAANRELQALAEMYRLSFGNITDVIYTIDRDLKISSISPSVERLLGYSPRDFIGAPVARLEKILTPASFAKAKADIEQISEGHTVPASVYEFRAADGTSRYSEISGALIVRDGGMIGIICIARDITERIQAEERLRQSELKHRTILENMDDAYYEVDLQGNLIFFNEALVRATGYSAAELPGMNYRRYVTSETHRQVEDIFRQVYETGRPVRLFDYAVQTKDGATKRFESWVNLILDDKKQPVGFRGMARDVTERRQAEAARLRAEANYRASLDDSLMGIRIVTPEGTTVYANQAALDLYGYGSLEEMKADPVVSRYTEESRAENKLRVEQRKRGEKWPVNYEISIKRKNGEIRRLEVFRKEILWNGVPHFQVLYSDITSRRQTEENLRQTLDSLRKAVAATIHVIASAVEARDPYTAGHQVRTADLARAIATELGLPRDRIDGIRLAGAVHDVGKLAIPSEILTKPTKLTDLEFSLVKEHARLGAEMLRDVESPWPLAEIVHQHHERMDGSGYPRGLKGADILPEARILAVADVVEAIASHRPYRPAFNIDAALEEIEKNKGTLYDEAAVAACLKLFRERGYCLPCLPEMT
ncbi:MAG: PAS domain S-box protein [Deltaproteobacteria bacterium]